LMPASSNAPAQHRIAAQIVVSRTKRDGATR
jgi:hypothetical protein